MVQRYENGFRCEISGCTRTFEPITDQNRLAVKRHQLDRSEHIVLRASEDLQGSDVLELKFGQVRGIAFGLPMETAILVQEREIAILQLSREEK